jgi:FkbM family methyltransferase
MILVVKIKFLVQKIRMTLFPTLHVKEVKRYFADGGDERFRFNFDLNENSLVIDLGGYKGQWASDIFSKFLCKILIFEPVLSYSYKISDRFKANNKIEVFSIALGDVKKTELIGISDDGSSSFVESNEYQKMEFEDVANFFSSHNIFNVDLLKINIEGGEYVLLSRLIETGLIKNIRQIHVQFHDFVPDAEKKMAQLQHKLSLTHELKLQYKFVWENWVLRNK